MQAAATATKVQPGCTFSLPDPIGEIKVVEQAKGPTAPTLNGKALKELGILIGISPVGPAYLLTVDGNYDFTRVFYSNGKYICGANGPRLGSSILVGVEVESNKGAHIYFNTGHIVFIPESWFQMTWVPLADNG